VADDLYKKVTPNINYYGTATFGTEPDMRQELANTFDGAFPEIAKSHPALLRRMRRDSNGKLTLCSCVNPVTREPDKDRFCPICYGEAYVWDEENIQIYKVAEDSDVDNSIRDNMKEVGLINAPLVVFYIRYNAAITTDDKIVILRLNEDGTKETPVRRQSLYRINMAWDYRSDKGKLEYWKAFTHEEHVKFINAPSYGDV